MGKRGRGEQPREKEDLPALREAVLLGDVAGASRLGMALAAQLLLGAREQDTIEQAQGMVAEARAWMEWVRMMLEYQAQLEAQSVGQKMEAHFADHADQGEAAGSSGEEGQPERGRV